jgi:hypothetical protein
MLIEEIFAGPRRIGGKAFFDSVVLIPLVPLGWCIRLQSGKSSWPSFHVMVCEAKTGPNSRNRAHQS